MAKQKYYAVMRGRKTGIFTNWAECEEQIQGFSGAAYKSFKTRQEAEVALGMIEQGTIIPVESKAIQWREKKKRILPAEELITDSICVDASCLGNPGIVEYRGVYTATNEVAFHKQPMRNGTNNLGEFLAIVHALAYLHKMGRKTPIYSDSETAITWVSNKRIKTTLKRDDQNEEIFDLIDRALAWLNSNEYENLILKWNTVEWDEIPADFGRK